MSMTPEQFALLATKDDVKMVLQETEDRIMQKFDTLLTAVDKIVKDYDDHKIEHVANLAAHDRLDTRITKLEKGVKQTV